MNTFYVVAVNQLKRTLQTRTVLINLFLLPLIVIFLLGTALAGADDIGVESEKAVDIRPVDLLLIESGSSPLIDGYLASEKASAYVNAIPVRSREQAGIMLREGKAGYALAVPDGFDADIASGTNVSLELIRGGDREQNRIAENVLNPFIDAVNDGSAAARLLGPQSIQAFEELPVPVSNARDGALGGSGETYTAFQYYAASMLVMFLMYAGLSLSASLHGERENRTLQRMYAMPIRPLHLFAGKVAAVGAAAALQALTIILVSKYLFGVDWGDQPLLLGAVCALLILFTMGLGVTVTFLTHSQPQSASAIQALIVAMTFLSGGFVPFEGWLRRLGDFTMNRWASESILRMMLHDPAAHVGSAIAVLAAIAAGLIMIALAVYARKGYAYE